MSESVDYPMKICPECGKGCGPRPFVTMGDDWFHGECFWRYGMRVIPTLTANNATLQARCDRYKAALESIAANTCCGPCQEAKLVARTALEIVNE